MKREIKFRAWHKNRKTFLDFDWAVDKLGRVFSILDKCVYDEFTDEIELMQYTGLKDNNGREVYEGDVLDIGLQNQDGKPVVAPVSYEKYIAGYVLDNGGNGIWQRLDEDCEVIGNIYENPELLEV